MSVQLKHLLKPCSNVCAGGDVDVLSVGEAMEPLFAATPAPADVQQCIGCTPSVKVVNVTWDGLGTPLDTDRTSTYTLELAGECVLNRKEAHSEL